MKRRTKKTQSKSQKLDRQQLGNVAGGGLLLSSTSYATTTLSLWGNDTRDK